MSLKYLPLFILFFFGRSVFAQSKLPVIKATSKKVAINDGGYLDKNTWSLAPKIKPDVFTADRTRKPKWVTFYTDIDSIRVRVKPGTRFDFIVLLNGKDSCYTQIASAIAPEAMLESNIATDDSIPFTLTSFNAIKVRTVINDTDTVNLHFDLSSFDFVLMKEVIAKRAFSKVHKLQMGSLVWNDPVINSSALTAHEMDGRFGWNLFEGKKVEIDYDHNLIIIHSRLPALKGYARSKIKFIHSYLCAEAVFKIENKKYVGDFMFDTGSDQALILDSSWARHQNFPTDHLKLIRTSVLRDARGLKYETRTVLSPLLEINGLVVRDIPTLVLGSKTPTNFEINFFGNDLLKRFNMVLDFRKDYLYLKPNRLMSLKYRGDS